MNANILIPIGFVVLGGFLALKAWQARKHYKGGKRLLDYALLLAGTSIALFGIFLLMIISALSRLT